MTVPTSPPLNPIFLLSKAEQVLQQRPARPAEAYEQITRLFLLLTVVPGQLLRGDVKQGWRGLVCCQNRAEASRRSDAQRGTRSATGVNSGANQKAVQGCSSAPC